MGVKNVNLIQPVVNIRLEKDDERYSKLNPVDFSLIQLLDGKNDISEIFGSLLSQKYDVDEIMNSFKLLFEFEIIKESPDSILGAFSNDDLEALKSQLLVFEYLSTEEKMIFEPFSQQSLSAQKRIKLSTICLIVDNNTSVKLKKSLTKVGFDNLQVHLLSDIKSKQDESNLVKQINSDIDLVIYCPDNFDEELVLNINKRCFDKKVKFIPFRVYQTSFEIGPVFIPNETSCYQCFINRRQGAIAPYLSMNKGNNTKLSELMDYNEFGLQLLVIESVKLISEITPPLAIDKIWFFDWLTGKSELNEVYKIPRCSLCGINRIYPEQKIWEQI